MESQVLGESEGGDLTLGQGAAGEIAQGLRTVRTGPSGVSDPVTVVRRVSLLAPRILPSGRIVPVDRRCSIPAVSGPPR